MDMLIYAVKLIFQIYIFIILLRAVLSWIPHSRFSPFIAPIYAVTEPVLDPIRRGLPPMRIGIDASPFLAIILLWLLQQLIIKLLLLI